ncbi:GPN-loop GTPase 3-like [Crassostrea virginica]|uniref:GPN-loop GTPase 3 n=1 Tax=Crassostrea virginica TaxID=6565 RepID=A0A8B8ELH4_CRAVI|nr:GPN-loop GTPase 3-like [Crassostrea virginica]XP_022341179.1 GPN-loop GTPase 3-like [Crassostrea virginica]
MPRYGQLVMGPAGSGKSTYCSNMVKHAEMLKRTIHVVNLDPAAEHFDYPVLADIRELIHLDDAMEDESLRFGPNGGLVFCMEYLAQNFDWLREQLEEVEDDYILFDCPGQIELYTHIPVMRDLAETLQKWDFRICGVFLVDSQFMIEPSKFISGILTALSTMVNLEIPHVNVMTKIDLLSKKAKKELERYLEPELPVLLAEEFDESRLSQKFMKLNSSIAKMIDDYSLVKFLPMDISDEDTINDILIQIDTAIQYGEDFEPREIPDMVDPDEGGEWDSGFDG